MYKEDKCSTENGIEEVHFLYSVHNDLVTFFIELFKIYKWKPYGPCIAQVIILVVVLSHLKKLNESCFHLFIFRYLIWRSLPSYHYSSNFNFLLERIVLSITMLYWEFLTVLYYIAMAIILSLGCLQWRTSW